MTRTHAIRSLHRLLVFCLFLGCCGAGVAKADPLLSVGQKGRSIVISWPTNAAGFNLEFLNALGLSNQWLIPFPGATNMDGQNVFTNAVASGSQFYRLRHFGGSPPILTNLTGPGSLSFNSTGSVSFAFADPDGDIACVQITVSNSLGVTSAGISAFVLGINGTNGTVSLPVNAAGLPFGPSSLSLQLIDSQGHRSQAAALNLNISGLTTGGTAPSITNLVPTASLWGPIVGKYDVARPTFTFAYSDPERILSVSESQP